MSDTRIPEALAGAGHGARVPLADGHCPPSTATAVTADIRTCANLLLTIGVRAEETLESR